MMSRKKGVAFSYILLVVEMFSSLLFTPFLIRSLGQSEYGLFSLVGSVTAYLMLLDLGVGNAIVRYMAKYRVLDDKRQQQNFLAVTTIFYILIGIVVIIVGLFLRNMLPTFFKNGLTIQELSKAQIMFSITMINAAITLILSPYNKTIVAFERFVTSKVIIIVRTILRVIISVIALKSGGDAVSIVKINLIMTILFGVISILFVIFKLKIVPKLDNVDIGFISEIVGYSAFIFIQMIATQINVMVDKVMLGAMASSAIVGIYSIGSQIPNYFESIAGSINGVLMPGVVRLVENKASPRELLGEMVRIGRLIFMILGLIWIVFFVFGQSFINLWVGEANAKGYLVAVIIMSPMVLSLTQAVGTQILWAKAKHKIQAYLKIVVSILNIGLTIILIKWNPLIGAAIGTSIALIIGDIIVMNIVFTKDIHISMKEYYSSLFRGILPSLLLTLIFGLVIKTISLQGWIGLIINGSLMCVVYLTLMFMYGMNEDEKTLIKSIIKRII